VSEKVLQLARLTRGQYHRTRLTEAAKLGMPAERLDRLVKQERARIHHSIPAWVLAGGLQRTV
jgi:hypothetical protein